MAGAILTVTIGAILIYSSIKGIGITDVLSGAQGDAIDPHGGTFTSPVPTVTDAANAPANAGSGTPSSGKWTAPAGGASSFKGPAANLLDYLAGAAVNQFHLTITATTNGGHVAGSYHYSGEAFDTSGSDADMRAFANWCVENFGPSLTELIHNPGTCIWHGKKVNGAVVYAAVWAGHRNHVHVAAASAPKGPH